MLPLLSPTAGGISVYRDVEYARTGGIRLALDAAVPRSAAPCPAVIVVHGGGWVRGDRRTHVEPLLRPLSDAGFAWFSISYRLITDVSQFGVAIQDVETAIRYVKAHAAEYGIDSSRIALVGESAGGQLAAMAALAGPPECGVKAVVAIYTPMDLVGLVHSPDALPQWIRENVRGTPWAGLILGRLKQLSPIEHVRREMPPFLLIHGTADPVVPLQQSRNMLQRVRIAGGSCELFPVHGAGHGIRWWESSAAMAEPYKREMVRWLQEKTVS